MRRLLFVIPAVLVGIVGVVVYSGLTREQEFLRLIAAGDTAVQTGQTFQAIEAYSGALALNPDSMAVHLKRGEAYQTQGDLAAAERDLRAAARLDPMAPRPRERLGDLAYHLGRDQAASEHYGAYVGLDDQNPRVLYKLAVVYERVGRVPRAVRLLRQALALDPSLAEAHYLLGVCLHTQNRLEEAAAPLERAIELSPGFLQAREALALVYRSLGDHRLELQQLDALAALDRDHPERHVIRGLAYARTGQTELAVLALGRAAEEHPDQSEVYAALGQVWLTIAEARDDHVALSKALEALRSVPVAAASSETLTLLGRALVRDGDPDAGREVLRIAVDRYPVDPAALLELARLEEADGNTTEAGVWRRRHQILTSPASGPRPVRTSPTG